jgi:hypothetical protein
MLARLPAFPGIIAAFGDLQRLVEHDDRVLLALLDNERKSQSWLREKMPSAFLICHAPDEANHSLASIAGFPLPAEEGSHCQETLAPRERQIAGTNGVRCCRQSPGRGQFGLVISDRTGRVARLLP